MIANPNRDNVARADLFAAQVGVVATIFRFLERTAGPVVDLAIRIWIAQTFFVSAVLKCRTISWLSRLMTVAGVLAGATIKLWDAVS